MNTTTARNLTAPNGKTVTTALSFRAAVALLPEHGSAFAGDLLAKLNGGVALTKNQGIYVYILAEEVLSRRPAVAPVAEVVAPVAAQEPTAEVAESAEAMLSRIEAQEAAFFARQFGGQTPAPVVEVAAVVPVAEPTPAPVAKPAPYLSIAELFQTGRDNGGKRLIIRVNIGGVKLTAKAAPETGRNPGGVYIYDGRKNDDDESTYYGCVTAAGEWKGSRDCTGDVLRALDAFAADPVKACADFGKNTGVCCFCGRELTDDKTGSSVELGYGPKCARKYSMPHGKKAIEEARKAAAEAAAA